MNSYNFFRSTPAESIGKDQIELDKKFNLSKAQAFCWSKDRSCLRGSGLMEREKMEA